MGFMHTSFIYASRLDKMTFPVYSTFN